MKFTLFFSVIAFATLGLTQTVPHPNLSITGSGKCKGGNKITAEISVKVSQRTHIIEIVGGVCSALGHEVADADDSELSSVPMKEESKGKCTVNNGDTVMAEVTIKGQTVGTTVSGVYGACNNVWPHGQVNLTDSGI